MPNNPPLPSETIYAPASALGRAGVAVIRISGVETAPALRTLLGGRSLPSPRVASVRRLVDQEGQPLDEALVLWFPGPKSFTGEDVAELHLHGGRAVVHSVLAALAEVEGLRPAEAGEFSRRAFANGRMDLAQLEAMADLIDAETALQQRQALRQMSGELSSFYEAIREQLTMILAEVEAYIDFPDEPIPEDTVARMTREAQILLKTIQEHLMDPRGKRLREGVQVAIVGAPNAGKSTLLNWLAKRDVAIVSETPGTTRDVVEAHLDLGGVPVMVADTAGLREAEDKIEQEGIRRSRLQAEQADLMLCLFDGQQWPEQDAETAQLAILPHAITLVTKSDQVSLNSLPESVFAISAKTGQGGEVFLKYVAEKVQELAGLPATPSFTRARHQGLLQETGAYLEAFIETQKDRQPIELQSENLRMASRSLGKITGAVDVETLLDHIFTRFCIGK